MSVQENKITEDQIRILSYVHRMQITPFGLCFEEPSNNQLNELTDLGLITRKPDVTTESGIQIIKSCGLYKETEAEYNTPDKPLIKKIMEDKQPSTLVKKIIELRGPDLLYAAELLALANIKNPNYIKIFEHVKKRLPFCIRIDFSHKFDQVIFIENIDKIDLDNLQPL